MRVTRKRKRKPASLFPAGLASDTLVAFTEYARTGSMTVAAQKLGVGPKHISISIAQLERRLKATLVHRDTRRMTLTPSGHAFYERAITILEQIQLAESIASWSSVVRRGTVTVAASSHVAEAILAPLINVFVKRYPGIVLRVDVFDDHDKSLLTAPADIKIWTASMRPENGVRLALAPRYLLASARYCDAEGRPRNLQELACHSLLRQIGICCNIEGPVNCSLKVKEVMSTNDVATLQAAIKSGLGIALVSPIGLADEIAAKTVEWLLPAFQGAPEAFWAITRPARPPAVELVLDYVKDLFATKESSCRKAMGEKAFTDVTLRRQATPCRARIWRARYRVWRKGKGLRTRSTALRSAD